MRKGPHLSCLATTSALFVAFQKVAERMIIQSLLLFNGHNVLERLLELLQMQIKISLVLRERSNFFVKHGDVSLIEVLGNWQSGTVRCQNFCEFWLVLLLH